MRKGNRSTPLAGRDGTDTIRPPDPAPLPPAMVPASTFVAESLRLADQIERLSELMETLTYRMLELEERLALQEERLACLDQANPINEPTAALEQRLEDTALRLARMEAALAGFDQERAAGAGSGRGSGRLQVLEPAAVGGSQEWPDPDPLDADPDPDPFYDEGEQPFMDERIA